MQKSMSYDALQHNFAFKIYLFERIIVQLVFMSLNIPC